MPGAILDQIRQLRQTQGVGAALSPAAGTPPPLYQPATPLPPTPQPTMAVPQQPGGVPAAISTEPPRGGVLAAVRAIRTAQPSQPAASPGTAGRVGPPSSALPAVSPTAAAVGGGPPSGPFRALGPGGRPQTREQAIRRAALHRQTRPPETRLEPGLGTTLQGIGTGVHKGLYTLARSLHGAMQPPGSPEAAGANAGAEALQQEYFQPYEEAAPAAMQGGEMLAQLPLFEAGGGMVDALAPNAGRFGRFGANALADAVAMQGTMPPETPPMERLKQTAIAPAMGAAMRVPGEVLAAIRGMRGANVPHGGQPEPRSAPSPIVENRPAEPAAAAHMAAKAEEAGTGAFRRRAADKIDALSALPPDEVAQFKARLRIEGQSAEARQQILAEAHDANAAWERVGGSREMAPQPERAYTPEEQAAGDRALTEAGYAGPERRAVPRPAPSEAATAMSARLAGEADIPGNLGPQGEMGGRMLANEPGGSTRALGPEDTQPINPADAPGPYDTQPIQPAETGLVSTGQRGRTPQSESLPPPRRHTDPKAFWDNATADVRAQALGVDPTQTRVHRGRWADLTPEAQAQVAAHLNPPPPPAPPPPPGTALAHGGSGGRGGTPIRRIFEPDNVSGGSPSPPGPPSPAVDEFFGRTAAAPSKARTWFPRVVQQIRETFVTSHKLRGEHVVYDPKLGETGATTSFADARNRIRLLADVSRHASARTMEALKPVVEGLNAKQLDILRRKVFIEDLLETAKRGERTPLTLADLKAEQARLDPLIAHDPAIARAFKRDQELWQAAGADLVKRGKLSANKLRQHYIHHEVMDYISEGAGIGRPSSLRNVARKYLRRRLGSSKDIYTNYLDVRYRSLAKHIRDNMIDDAVKEIADRYGVPKADAERLGYVPFSTEDLWKAAGQTSHDQAVMRFVTDVAREMPGSVSTNILKAAEERLLKHKVYIHPDLAETLSKLRDIYQEPGVLAKVTGRWKQAMLNKNPLRYNFNNMIGDAERGWNALPEMFKDGGRERMGRVLRDMRDAAKGHPSTDYRLAEQHSVVDSGEVYHEIGSIKEAEAFRHLNESDLATWRHPLAYVSGKLRNASTARENLLRLQAFYTNLDRMRAGLPLAEGVSDIRGMSDPVAVAAKVSREALGDYGDMTPREVKMRRGILPFYSWLKINTSFWPTLFARRGAGAGAKAAARLAPRAVLKSGLAIGKATAIYGAASAFNNTVMRQQEESLPEDVRRKFHINTGLRDRKGRWVTISEPTAMSDFMDSIGVEGITTDVAQLLRGQLSAADFATGAASRALSPLRKVASRVTPAITGPVEAVTGKRFYPDPLDPASSIERNPIMRLVSGMGFGEYASPQRAIDTYKHSLVELGAVGVRRYDAGLSALRNTEDRVRKFRAAKGFIDDAPSEGPLTAFNRQLMYALADKNYTRAAALLRKTTPAAFGRYLTARDPMVRIPMKMRREFIATLSPHDLEQIKRARAFLTATGTGLKQTAQ